MGLFDKLTGLFKPKAVKEIYGRTWGQLVQVHGITVDELQNNIRCVDKPTEKDGSQKTLLRIFALSDIERKGISVDGWETFDKHPELLMFEGHMDDSNEVYLERRNHQ